MPAARAWASDSPPGTHAPAWPLLSPLLLMQPPEGPKACVSPPVVVLRLKTEIPPGLANGTYRCLPSGAIASR